MFKNNFSVKPTKLFVSRQTIAHRDDQLTIPFIQSNNLDFFFIIFLSSTDLRHNEGFLIKKKCDKKNLS